MPCNNSNIQLPHDHNMHHTNGYHHNMAPLSNSQPQLTQQQLQQIIGVLLYYVQALDLTMLVTLGSLTAAQAEGTQVILDACTQLLNYAATHPEAVLWYTASNMHHIYPKPKPGPEQEGTFTCQPKVTIHPSTELYMSTAALCARSSHPLQKLKSGPCSTMLKMAKCSGQHCRAWHIFNLPHPSKLTTK